MTTTAQTAPTQRLTTPSGQFAFRSFGKAKTRPVVLLNHLAANLDNWDPALLNGIASSRTVVTFDNRGVGRSDGNVPKTIEQMADDAAEFIAAFSRTPVDVLGLSMGGMVAQELVFRYPDLVNKLVLVGTGPRGGEGINRVTRTTFASIVKATLSRADPKQFIFFGRNATGKNASSAFLARLAERMTDRDKPVSVSAFIAQLRAIHRFGTSQPSDLSRISLPTLIINGDNDIMVPTVLSSEMAAQIPAAQLEIFEDAGHGSLFQYPLRFVERVDKFLEQ